MKTNQRIRAYGVRPTDGSDLRDFGFEESEMWDDVLVCVNEKDADACLNQSGLTLPPLKKVVAWAVVERFTEWG